MSVRPIRVQRQRTKGWQAPGGAVYVGRPTIWGNLFIHPDPSEAVAAYRRLISGGTQSFELRPGGLQWARNAHPNCTHWAYPEFIKKHVYTLRGKTLMCWCKIGDPCHADVLLELANTLTTERKS